MFPSFSNPLSLLGFCFLVFSVARIFHSIAMFLEDNEKPDFVVYPISFICFCLYFCVLPFTLFMYVLFRYPRSRADKISYKDGQDSMESLMKSEIRIAVQKENERMRAFMESALDQQHAKLSDLYKKKLQEELDQERGRLLWDILRKNPPASTSEPSEPSEPSRYRAHAHTEDGTVIKL